MKKNRVYKGTGVALITPFDNDNNIDFDALTKLVKSVIAGGVDFLVVMGTTAESVTLNKEEKKQVLDHIYEVNNGKLPIVLGIGSNNTLDVVNQVDNKNEKYDAILSVVPYYNKPSQKGIYCHFEQIAQSTDKDIILYNVPGRTGKDMEAETIISLGNDFENIVGVKEASGNFAKAMDIIRNKPDNFVVLSGEDDISLPLISSGMEGVISVVANAFPYEWSEMVDAARRGNLNEARLFHYTLLNITRMMFKEGNPAGVKAVLEQKNMIKNVLRLPLVSVSDELYKDIGKQLKSLKF